MGAMKPGRLDPPSADATFLARLSPVAAGILVVGAAVSLFSCWPSWTDLLRPFLAAATLLLAARRLGAWIHRGSLEEEILSGFLMLSFIPVLNQLAGLPLLPVAWWVVIGWLALASLVQRPPEGGDLARVVKRMEKDAEDAGAFGILYFLPAVVAMAWAFVPAVAPPVGMDALTYHLGLPAQYLARASLTPPDGLVYYQYTQAGEMLALLALTADDSGSASTLVLGLMLPLGAIAGGRMAAELAMVSDRRSRATAALARVLGFAAMATLPILLFTVAHGKTDAFALALTLAGARRVITRSACPFRAGFLLGGAVAAKLSAAYVVVPALLWLAWRERRRPLPALLSLGLSAVAPAYWLARNLIHFGTPLPQAAYLTDTLGRLDAATLAAPLLRFVGSTFLLVHHGIDGPVGPVVAALLLLSAGGLFLARSQVRASAGIGLMAFAAWAITGGAGHAYAPGGLLRFLLPALAVASAAGAALAAELILPRGGRTRQGTLLGGVLAAAMVATAVSAGAVVGRAFPAVDVLTGRVGRDAYLQGWLSTGAIQREASRILPPTARVLSVGESRLFPLRRDARFDAEADRPRVYRALASSGGDSRVLDRLRREEGWTHVLHAADVYARNIVVGLAPPPSEPDHREIFERWLATRGRVLLVDHADHATLYVLN